ncbi:MAG: hypothetical protein L0Z50_30345, partial [Verrucomicrobiales bacterium]|nr:hypothetical protein [Verrucomicrobiales bacterium]
WTDAESFTHRSGKLGGIGAITKRTPRLGVLTNEATLRVGNPFGTLQLKLFNFTQSASGEMVVGLAAEGAGLLELASNGARATLGGALRVELAAGFVPEIGQTFDIITASNRTGEFANVVLPDLGPGKRLSVTYSNTKVTLTVTP